MMKQLTLFLTLLMMLFLFSGCVERELTLRERNLNQTHDNIWNNEIDLEENIDTSDLYIDDLNATEMETIITEEIYTEKIERVAFPVEEYRRLGRRGRGTVKGKIYINNSYGNEVIGSGTRLYLNPITSYSMQWYEESYLDGGKMQKADARLFNYLRFTASNSSGEFAFYGVPSGSYYLIGTVKCATECGYSSPKSIRIATEVSIRGNKIVQKDLTRMIE